MKRNRRAALFALTAGATLASLPANASCIKPDSDRPRFIEPILLAAPYDPTTAAALTLSATPQIQTPPELNNCAVTLTVSGPAALTSPTTQHTLPIALTGNLATPPTNAPLQANRTYTYPGTIELQPGRNIPPGPYTAALTLSVYENAVLLDRTTVVVTADVRSVCTLPQPSPAQLDFSPGVATGRVQAGYRQTTIISQASCNGPSRLRISGQPLTASAPNAASYTNIINYEATASFGGTIATYHSSQPNELTSAIPAATGQMSIDVTLTPSQLPLTAGRYASVLHITLEPAN